MEAGASPARSRHCDRSFDRESDPFRGEACQTGTRYPQGVRHDGFNICSRRRTARCDPNSRIASLGHFRRPHVACSASISSAPRRARLRSSRACTCMNSCTTAATCSASPATKASASIRRCRTASPDPGRCVGLSHAAVPDRRELAVEDDRNDDRIFVVAGNDRRLRRRPAFVWFVESRGRARGRSRHRLRIGDGRGESQGRARRRGGQRRDPAPARRGLRRLSAGRRRPALVSSPASPSTASPSAACSRSLSRSVTAAWGIGALA